MGAAVGTKVPWFRVRSWDMRITHLVPMLGLAEVEDIFGESSTIDMHQAAALPDVRKGLYPPDECCRCTRDT